MNASDWVAASGHPIVGRGHRPINPRLLAGVTTKARPAKSGKSGREMRRLVLRVAQLTGAVDDMLAPVAPRRRRAAPRDASLAEQSQPGPAGLAAQLRHAAAVQRARRLT